MSLFNVSKHEPRKNYSTNQSTPIIKLIASMTKKHRKLKLFFPTFLAKKETQNTVTKFKCYVEKGKPCVQRPCFYSL